MSDDEGDVEDITSICGGLNINIGTLNKNTIPSMYLAGKKANELGHVVLLDPVGAGASKLRTDTAVGLMKEIRFDVIRGNISEIKTLAYGSGSTRVLMPMWQMRLRRIRLIMQWHLSRSYLLKRDLS